MDDKILFLYAQGMTSREIVAAFKEMYGADVSAGLISRVTEAVIEQGVEWQFRPLDAMYPIGYLDCVVVKAHQDKKVINKAFYLALGVNRESHKELLGLWLPENEGSCVLAQCAHRAEQSRRQGYLDCLCRWAQGLSGGNQYRAP